ncbi:MAG: tetratricopeptide repeat protein [Promethearchaeota archaeon]
MSLLKKYGKVPRMLTRVEQLLSTSELDEALQIVQDIEETPALTPHDRLMCDILKSTILNKLGLYRESLEVAEQAFQDSQVLNEPLRQVDSLIKKVNTLWELGRLDEGLQVIEQAEQAICLVKGQASEISSRMASLFYHKGVIYAMKGMEDQALQYFQQSLAFSEELEDQKELAQCLNAIGIIYRRKGDLDQALIHQQRSLVLREQLGDKQGIARSLNSLGYIYWLKGDLDWALECYQQTLDLSEELGTKKDMAAALGNMGLIYQDQGDLERALEHQEQSLALSQEIGNPQDIAIDLDNIGRIYSLRGDLQQALQYHQRALTLKEQIGNKNDIAMTLISLGKIFMQKGELNQALTYYKQSLVLFEEVDNRQHIAESLENIAMVYAEKGAFEQGLEHLEKSLTIYEEVGNNLKISSTLFSLILVGLDRNSGRTIDYFQRLKEIKDQENNKLINQRYQVAEALLLKSSTRSRDKIKATELLEQIVEEEIVDHELIVIAMLNLCDLLLKELRISEEVLDEINSIVNTLLVIAKNQHSHSLLVETYLLKAKLGLVELDVQGARQWLIHAQLLAEERGLTRLAIKVSNEHDSLLESLNTLEKFSKLGISLPERIKLARLDEQLGHMIQRKSEEMPEISPEEPILLLILDKTGLCLYSTSFAPERTIDDQLTSGFLTAMQSFSTHVFAQAIERVKLEDYTLLMKHEEPLQVCYVFEGQSYRAQQKLAQFTADIRKSNTIWLTLAEASKNRQALPVSSQRAVKSLEKLLNKIFFTDKKG